MVWSDNLPVGTPAYEIAATTNEHVRVIAGPGTGKSFAMKRRVARLLENGVEAGRILPVTFTRVAAEDLHRELVGMGVPGCQHLKGMTLHSLAMKILMRNHVLLSTGRTPRPLNDFETKPLEADLSNSHGGVINLRKKIKAYEAGWARLQQDEPGFVQTQADLEFSNDLISWLNFHSAMLIGEVIPYFYRYLQANPAATERTEFYHILVDEYQDLNKAEQGVIHLLSEEAEVCIVGDDDQSIYSFKHAHPDGIRDWILERPDADDLTLETCFRCPTLVAEMANHLIRQNRNRPVIRDLAPRIENGEGNVRIIQYVNHDEEITGIVDLVLGMIEEGVPPGDILILAQRGVIGTPIYEGLIQNEIAARSYYAEAELDAEDAQRRFALLKLFVDREDKVALRWLLGLGSNNWRTNGWQRIRHYCEENRVTPWIALSRLNIGDITIPYTRSIVEAFSNINTEIEALEEFDDLDTVLNELLPDNREEIRDLRLLAFQILEEIEDDDRQLFLTEFSSAISKPEIPTEITEVRIMSIHKSKGLSSPVTILAGCVDGLLPKEPNANLPMHIRQEAIDEQRRLFFVGITRVKADIDNGKPGTLILTGSQRMTIADAMGAGITPAYVRRGIAHLNASRFINELGPMAPNPTAG